MSKEIRKFNLVNVPNEVEIQKKLKTKYNLYIFRLILYILLSIVSAIIFVTVPMFEVNITGEHVFAHMGDIEFFCCIGLFCYSLLRLSMVSMAKDDDELPQMGMFRKIVNPTLYSLFKLRSLLNDDSVFFTNFQFYVITSNVDIINNEVYNERFILVYSYQSKNNSHSDTKRLYFSVYDSGFKLMDNDGTLADDELELNYNDKIFKINKPMEVIV